MRRTVTDQQPSPVLYPIIVSVFGRSEIDPPNLPLIRSGVETVLKSLRLTCGSALHVMTATEMAADRLVTAVALEMNIPRILVAPWGSDGAGTAVRADHVIRLPRPIPKSGQSQYDADRETLNGVILESAHIILSIGDEAPSAEEQAALSHKWTGAMFRPGSAADAVTVPIALKIEAGLDTETSLPWLRMTGENVAPEGKPPVSACMLHDPRTLAQGRYIAELRSVFSAFATDTKQAVSAIMGLNDALGALGKLDQKNFTDQFQYLSAEGVPDPDGDAQVLLRRLRVLQSGVDAVARGFQRWLLGVGVPAHNFEDWYRQAKNNRTNGGWFFSISTLFMFCLLVPAIVILFELYSHAPDFLHVKEHKRFFLYGYVIIFFVGFVIYMCIVKRRKWQDQFQDYRVLAEALRVQVFWSLAMIPDQVADHYLYKHRAELGWIRYALRGVTPWSIGVAHAVPGAQRDLIRQGWMMDQEGYYGRAAGRNHAAAARARRWTLRALAVGFGTALLLAGAEWFAHGDFGLSGKTSVKDINDWLGCEWFTDGIVKNVKYTAIIIMGSMPAIAAFFGLSAEIRAYEGHAQGYGMMRAIFSRALSVEKSTVGNDDAFRYLVFELGKEAINENAGWLMDHRHRPIENRVG